MKSSKLKVQKFKLIAGAVLAVVIVTATALGQYAFPRPANVNVFAGTGLQAASVQTNNWTVAGPLGALAGSTLATNWTPIVADKPLSLLIRYNQHGFGTNQAFFFSLTSDGTNFGYNSLITVNCAQATDGFSVPGGATNGWATFTNFTADVLRGAVGIRLERFTNQVAISNIIITANQVY